MRLEPLQFRDDFLRLIQQKEEVAKLFQDNKRACLQSWEASGYAVEFALKAAIMRRKGMNVWDNSDRSLKTHDLRGLYKRIGVDPSTVPEGVKANLMTVFVWERESAGYTGSKLPRRIAKEMYRACFGSSGVVPWLTSL